MARGVAENVPTGKAIVYTLSILYPWSISFFLICTTASLFTLAHPHSPSIALVQSCSPCSPFLNPVHPCWMSFTPAYPCSLLFKSVHPRSTLFTLYLPRSLLFTVSQLLSPLPTFVHWCSTPLYLVFFILFIFCFFTSYIESYNTSYYTKETNPFTLRHPRSLLFTLVHPH